MDRQSPYGLMAKVVMAKVVMAKVVMAKVVMAKVVMAISMVGVERQEQLLAVADTDDTVVQTSQYLCQLEDTKHTSGPTE